MDVYVKHIHLSTPTSRTKSLGNSNRKKERRRRRKSREIQGRSGWFQGLENRPKSETSRNKVHRDIVKGRKKESRKIKISDRSVFVYFP